MQMKRQKSRTTAAALLLSLLYGQVSRLFSAREKFSPRWLYTELRSNFSFNFESSMMRQARLRVKWLFTGVLPEARGMEKKVADIGVRAVGMCIYIGILYAYRPMRFLFLQLLRINSQFARRR